MVCVGPVRKPHYWLSHIAACIDMQFMNGDPPGVRIDCEGMKPDTACNELFWGMWSSSQTRNEPNKVVE